MTEAIHYPIAPAVEYRGRHKRVQHKIHKILARHSRSQILNHEATVLNDNQKIRIFNGSFFYVWELPILTIL
jgi:hypothetical protein